MNTGEDWQAIENSGLIKGVPPEKRAAVLRCLDARVEPFGAGELITPRIGADGRVACVLSGSIRIIRLDYEGNRSILATCSPGMAMGRDLTPLLYAREDMAAVANEDGSLLTFAINPEIESCTCCVKYVSLVRGNLIAALTTLNTALMEGVQTLSCRSIREKVLRYLNTYARVVGSTSFEIPYNRQELADLLCIERSALSRELGRLRDEGVIAFNRSRFSLLKTSDQW